MKFLFLILLLASCGKKTVWDYPPLPADQASPEEKLMIEAELDKIEKDFADIGTPLDLRSLPVVVAPLPFGVVGRCQYGKKNRGAYIVLSPALFTSAYQYADAEAHLFEKEFVRVLIHEIGHCYFYRNHEEETYLESPGNSFELRSSTGSVIFDRVPRSVMPASSAYRMPKSLRKYYLAELGNQARLTDSVSLREFTDFQVLEHGHNH